VEFFKHVRNAIRGYILTRNTKEFVDMVRIVEIPRTYLERKGHARLSDASVSTKNLVSQNFERFLRTVLNTGVPLAHRIVVNSGNTTMMCVTIPGKGRVIRSVFEAHFPEFTVELDTDSAFVPIEDDVHSALIRGVPKSATLALNSMTQVMAKSICDSFYQACVIPTKPGRIRRFIAKKRYKSALERTQQQDTTQTWLGGQATKSRIDVDAQRSSKRFEVAFRRMNASRLLRCRVVIGFWGSSDSEIALHNAVDALMGALSPDDKDERLKVTYLSGQRARDLLGFAFRLESRGLSTDLLPAEAVPYFEIPTIELGIRHSSPASFSLATTTNYGTEFKQGYVTLGPLYRYSSQDQSRLKYLELENLRKHTLIVGKTGTGKSTTKNRIVIDAWKNGIPSLLIEPAKNDARILLGAIPELRVFTLGEEMVAPFRLNPFLVPEKVSVRLHMNLLHSCFVAAWPTYGILANHLRRVLVQTYLNNGWDPLTSKRGDPITLDMFRDETIRYCNSFLRYGSELSQDFRGALLARAEDLCDLTRAAIFNTTENLPMSELLSQPTIIELKYLGDPEFTAFVLSLLLVRVYEHFDQLKTSRRLRSLLVIDEAHRILEELPKMSDMSETAAARRKALDQLINLIAEARSLGLGVILADQIPTRIARDAIKNCHTMIVHKLTSPEDQELMAQETGCNREQGKHIAELKDGEAVVREPSSNSPFDVQVIHDPDSYPEMWHDWTDEDVRERMRKFYEEHPSFAKTPDIPVLLSPISDANLTDDSVSVTVQVDDIVQTSVFKELYEQAVTEVKEDTSSHALEELIAHYSVYLRHISGHPIGAAHALVELTAVAYGPPSRPPDINLIERLVAEISSRGVESTGSDHHDP
jgi:hypothetical protein